MRQKRAKAYRKLMHLYCMSFGFRQPYQVLVDSLMCLEATTSKIELSKQIANVLQGTVKPMITQCCIHELYLKGHSVQPAVDLAKTFERRKCNHREAIPGDECLKSVVGETNKHRYVIATQSQTLRQSLRQIPAVPLVHVNRAVMILEPPSEKTKEVKEKTDEANLLPPEPVPLPSAIAGPSTSAEQSAPPPVKKRKGPKGPNPLSVKKKKAVKDDKSAAMKGKDGKTDWKKMERGKDKANEIVEIGKKRRREEDDAERVNKKRATSISSDAVDRPSRIGGADIVQSQKMDDATKASGVVVARRGRKRNRQRNKGKSGDTGEARGDDESGSDGDE